MRTTFCPRPGWLLAVGWFCLASGCRAPSSLSPNSTGVITSTVLSDPSSSLTSRFYATLPYDSNRQLYVRLDWIIVQRSRIPISWTDVTKHVEMLIAEALENALKVHNAAAPMTDDDLRKVILGPTPEGRPSAKAILSEYGIMIFAEKFMTAEIQEIHPRG